MLEVRVEKLQAHLQASALPPKLLQLLDRVVVVILPDQNQEHNPGSESNDKTASVNEDNIKNKSNKVSDKSKLIQVSQAIAN